MQRKSMVDELKLGNSLAIKIVVLQSQVKNCYCRMCNEKVQKNVSCKKEGKKEKEE